MNERILPAPILAGFIVAIAAVISIALLGYRSLRIQAATARQVSHTAEVRSESEALLAAMVDAETGQRGYLLTGDQDYLEPYDLGRREALIHLAALRRLTGDNGRQQERLALAQTYMNQKLSELAETIAARRSGNIDAAMAVVRKGLGKASMDRFRAVMTDVRSTEQSLLESRQAELNASTQFTFAVIAGGGLVLLLLIAGAFVITSRDFRARNVGGWIKSGQADLAAAIAGNQSMESVVRNALAFLAKYLNAGIGGIYVVIDDGSLRRVASYATNGDGESARADRILKGDGLVGRAAVENKILTVDDTASASSRQTTHAVAVPIRLDGQVKAVIDLGLPHALQPYERELLDHAATQLCLAIRAAQDRERVTEANRELEAFSYTVSHDLRAPFRHIDGFTQLLQKRTEGLDEKGRHYVERIADSARRAGQLVDDLLAFSRTAKTDLHRERVNSANIVAEVKRVLEPDMAERSITWRVAPLPPVDVDPAMLRVVFHNLLSNAIKYTRGRPVAEIEVGWERRGDDAEFFVRDNGVGFDMAYIDKLFGVFQRLHLNEDFEGSGIGLATVRRIVQRHGGQTRAVGELNKGATFYFTLPLDEKESVNDRAEAHPVG